MTTRRGKNSNKENQYTNYAKPLKDCSIQRVA